jgi:hypothetical protein
MRSCFPPMRRCRTDDRSPIRAAPLIRAATERQRFPAATARAAAVAIFCALVVGAVAGCNKSPRDWFKRKTTQDYVDMALESPNADERRAGVNGLAASADANTDWAVKVFDTIARTDSNSAVRCAAVRALRCSAGPDRVPTLLKLLRSGAEPVADVRAAPGPLRWEAAKLLAEIAGGHSYDATQREEIVRVMLDRASAERDRNTRLTLIDALAYFPDRVVLERLIDLLREDDFAVQRSAESALIALTGVTHRHSPDAWHTWLSAADDPFALAGHLPPEAQVRSKSNWSWDW